MRNLFLLVAFLLPLIASAQFPTNPNRLKLGQQTTALGIINYSDTIPLHTPASWLKDTEVHVDTSEDVRWWWTGASWRVSGEVRRMTAPPSIQTIGGRLYDWREAVWWRDTDSTFFRFNYEGECWQPLMAFRGDTIPADEAAIGSSAAVCYTASPWYDTDADSLKVYTAGEWVAVSPAQGNGIFDAANEGSTTALGQMYLGQGIELINDDSTNFRTIFWSPFNTNQDKYFYYGGNNGYNLLRSRSLSLYDPINIGSELYYLHWDNSPTQVNSFFRTRYSDIGGVTGSNVDFGLGWFKGYSGNSIGGRPFDTLGVYMYGGRDGIENGIAFSPVDTSGARFYNYNVGTNVTIYYEMPVDTPSTGQVLGDSDGDNVLEWVSPGTIGAGNGIYDGPTSLLVPGNTRAITPDSAGIIWADDELHIKSSVLIDLQSTVSVNNNRIQNVANPSAATDAVNLQTLADTLNTAKLDSITLVQDSILLGWIRGVEVSRDTIAGTGGGGSSLWTVTGSDIYRNSAVTINSTSAPAYTLDVIGTDGIRIPVGTTAQRPTGADGVIRYNNTTENIEAYNGATAAYDGLAWESDVPTNNTTTNYVPYWDGDSWENTTIIRVAADKYAVGNNINASNSTRALNVVGTDAVMRVLRISSSLVTAAPSIELVRRSSASGPDLEYYDMAIETDGLVFRQIQPSLYRYLYMKDGRITFKHDVRLEDIPATPTRLIGADADGDLGAVTLGSGLSLATGTLSAQNIYNTNGTITAARTVTIDAAAGLTFDYDSQGGIYMGIGATPFELRGNWATQADLTIGDELVLSDQGTPFTPSGDGFIGRTGRYISYDSGSEIDTIVTNNNFADSYYSADADLTITAPSGIRAVARVELTASGTEQLDVTIPAPSADLVGVDIIIAALDDNGTYNVVVAPSSGSVYTAETGPFSTYTIGGRTVTFTCMQSGASSYGWFVTSDEI